MSALEAVSITVRTLQKNATAAGSPIIGQGTCYRTGSLAGVSSYVPGLGKGKPSADGKVV